MDSGKSPESNKRSGYERFPDSQREEKKGMRGEIKKKKKKNDCCWRRCCKSLCLKNSLVLPFICRYIGGSQLSGSQHYIWNKEKRNWRNWAFYTLVCNWIFFLGKLDIWLLLFYNLNVSNSHMFTWHMPSSWRAASTTQDYLWHHVESFWYLQPGRVFHCLIWWI